MTSARLPKKRTDARSGSIPRPRSASGIEPDQASVRFFGILALVIGVAGYSIASTSVNLFVEWLGWLLEGRPGTLADYATRSSAFETVAGLVAANRAIGSAILVAAGLLR